MPFLWYINLNNWRDFQVNFFPSLVQVSFTLTKKTVIVIYEKFPSTHPNKVLKRSWYIFYCTVTNCLMEDSLHIHTKYFDFIGFFHIKARVKEVLKRKRNGMHLIWSLWGQKKMKIWFSELPDEEILNY